MKTALSALILSLTFTSLVFAADPPPPVQALQAAQIAQADLEERGLQGKIYIEQIILKQKSVMNAVAHWEILWNDDFPAQTEGRKEFGLRVLMDGSYKRSVK